MKEQHSLVNEQHYLVGGIRNDGTWLDSDQIPTTLISKMNRLYLRLSVPDEADAGPGGTFEQIERLLQRYTNRRPQFLAGTNVVVAVTSFGGTDKYGRTLASIEIPGEGDLSQALLREKLAYPYDGGSKNRGWDKLLEERQALLDAEK